MMDVSTEDLSDLIGSPDFAEVIALFATEAGQSLYVIKSKLDAQGRQPIVDSRIELDFQRVFDRRFNPGLQVVPCFFADVFPHT